jgi:hypothetical protein
MTKKKKKTARPDESYSPPEGLSTPRELVVIAKPEAGLRATPAGSVESVAEADVSPLVDLLASEGATLEPLFGISEERLRREAESMAPATGMAVSDLSVYYWVQAPDERLDELAERLQQQELVEAAYVKPPGEPPVAPPDELEETIETPITQPVGGGPPEAPPDFTGRQGYLNTAPEGIDARYAWTLPGGGGAGINIIDLEWGWRFTHEDLRQNQGGVVAGTSSSSDNHGTAVLGEYSGDRNTTGVTGICPDAHAMAVAFSMPYARAIRTAADRLRPGDIMLLEIHLPGPRHGFQSRSDQRGYIAVEWWPDVYEAIRYAVNRGIVVVEAAGNGRENLDDSIYDTNPSPPHGPFPSWWHNPFERDPLDSGAIVVGAGSPPPGTHGRDHGPDRSRLDFSNYGALIDAQGWGREVTTTGYGYLWKDPADPNNRDRWYRDTFGGTSSASPIVVGALGCVQGILRRHGKIPLSPARARELLRATGSPQQDATGRPRTQRIGNRPNLRQLIARALETRTWVGVQFRGTIPAGRTYRWFTFNWPAHWHVIWTVVPTSPRRGAPQIKWKVQVERASDRYITYWISITNVSSSSVNIEARYAVLGW